MKYSEVAKISYGIIDAAPYGRIDTKEQYDYMVAFNNRSNFGFYWNDNDRHVPTYEEYEIVNKALQEQLQRYKDEFKNLKCERRRIKNVCLYYCIMDFD